MRASGCPTRMDRDHPRCRAGQRANALLKAGRIPDPYIGRNDEIARARELQYLVAEDEVRAAGKDCEW